MKPPRPDVACIGLVDSPLALSAEDVPFHQAVIALLSKTLAVADLELRKLRHDPVELLTRAVQPGLWLLIFGRVMAHAHVIDTPGLPYLDYLTPGILAQSVLFIAIFNGISVIWEKDLGIVYKFLVSPTPRAAFVLGKALGSSARALVQSIVVIVLATALGVKLRLGLLPLAGVVLVVVLGASVFSTFSLIVACLVKSRERFMGVGQLLTMPFFFASNAIYPTSMMPPSLQVVAHLNPLTFQVDALRLLLLPGFAKGPLFGVGVDVMVLLFTLAILVGISAWLYPRIAR